jgi:PAS domain-containing protein
MSGRAIAILVLDVEGIIVDSWTGDDGARASAIDWIGRPWADVVSAASRDRVLDLISKAKLSRKPDAAMIRPQTEIDGLLYSAVRLDHSPRLVAIAHERAAIERGEAFVDESITPRLFHFSNEALIVVRADDMQIVGANEACGLLIGKLPEDIAGTQLDSLLRSDDSGAIMSLLKGGETTRKTIAATIGGRALAISALPGSPSSAYILLRLDAANDDTQHFDDLLACATLKEMLVKLPDALAAIDQTGKILMANQAFVELVRAPSEAGVRLSPIGRWLGPTEEDANQLVNKLLSGETISDHHSVIWTESGNRVEVQLSAIPALTAMPLCYALLIKKRQPQIAPPAPAPTLN